MATGLATAIANAWLNGLCRATPWTVPPAFFVKLHIGDPGPSGTASPAGDTRRVQGVFSAAAGAAITNSAPLDWLNVTNNETYSHVSFWDTAGPAGGTFLGSDALNVSKPVTVGDNFQLATGDIDFDLTAIAA